MSFIDKLGDVHLRKMDEEELRLLESIYVEIAHNSDQVVQIACAFGIPIAEVFFECQRARKMINERLMELRKQFPTIAKQEMA